MGSGDLHTAITLNSSSSSSSSSSKFGSFILYAAVDFENFREDAVFMLSSVSESESESRSSESVRYKSFGGGLWSTGFNGFCSKCDSGSGSGWRWSDNDGLRCCKCRRKWHNNISGGGGGELSNDDQQQQQQQLVLKLGNLGFPSCYSFGGNKQPPKVMVVGSCDGLICLYDEQSNDVSFWNPATRQFRILPKSSSSSSSSSSITIAAAAAGSDGNVHRLFAFGFDDKTKDYKVVLLSVVVSSRMLDFVIKDEPAAPLECVCRVQVYSSSTNSWKLLKGITSLPGSPFPYPSPDSSSSSSELFYLNGCCFFMAKLLYSSSEEQQQCIIPPPKMGDRFMISLDLTNETVTPIELPLTHYLHQLSLFYLGRKIALCYKQEGVCRQVVGGVGVDDVSTTCFLEVFCIHVFNELSSVWAYLVNFSIKLGLPPGERNILRGISNDAVFALIETEILGGLGSKKKKKKKLKLYNLITKKMKKKNFLSCDQVLSKAFPYKPSQVWIAAAAAAADMGGGECSSQPASQPASQPVIID